MRTIYKTVGGGSASPADPTQSNDPYDTWLNLESAEEAQTDDLTINLTSTVDISAVIANGGGLSNDRLRTDDFQAASIIVQGDLNEPRMMDNKATIFMTSDELVDHGGSQICTIRNCQVVLKVLDGNTVSALAAVSQTLRLENCIFTLTDDSVTTNGSIYGYRALGAPADMRWMVNTIFYNLDKGGTNCFGVRDNSGTEIVNAAGCIFFNCGTGIRLSSAACNVQNCILGGNAQGDYFGNWVPDYNISEDAEAAGTNGTTVADVSALFLDAANGDFRLSASGITAVSGAGNPNTDQLAYGYTADITGQDITGNFPVGPVAPAPVYGIETEPTELVRESAFSFTVQNAATTPTPANSSFVLDPDGASISVAVDSVSGTGPWVLTSSLIPANAALQHGNIAVRVSVDSETVDSSAIPFNPPTGHVYGDLTSATGDLATSYQAATVAAGFQGVVTSPTSPDSIPVTVSAIGELIPDTTPGQDQTVNVYFIAPNGTVHATEVYTFAPPVLTIGAISNTEPSVGDVITIEAAGVTSVTSDAGAVPFTQIDDTHISIEIPDPIVFGNRTLNFLSNTSLTLNAGGLSGTVDIQIYPKTGYSYAVITQVAGIYGDDPVVVGDRAYGYFVSGSGNVDLAIGSIQPAEISVFRYWIQDQSDGVWSSVYAEETLYAITDAPEFSGPINAPIAQVGQPYSFNLASYFTHPSGKALSYAFTNLPAGLEQDTNSVAVVVGTPTTEQTNSVEVTVTDTDNVSTGPHSFSLRVNQAPQWSTITDVNARVGQSINITLSNYISDADVITYSVNQLPDGLTLSNGVISGILTAIGTLVSTVTADDGNLSANTTITWEITSGPVLLNDIPSQALVVDDVVSIQIDTYFYDADDDPLTFSSTQLPQGLELNAATGLLSGVVSQVEELNVVFSATDGTDSTDSNSVNFIVNDIPVFAGPIADQGWEAGESVSINLSLYFSDTHVLFYAINSGALPAGVSLNQTTGMVTGTVSGEATGNVVFSATDGSETQVSNTIAWEVNAAPSETSTIPDISASVGETLVSFNVNSFVSDARPLTFSADNLPAGISLDANTGEVSGTFTTGEDVTTVITANDGSLSTALTAFTWSINSLPVFAGSIPPVSGTVDIPALIDYSSNFSDPDGGPLFFTAIGLPDGLVIGSNTGVITGTPTSTGSYTITITANDGVDEVSSNPFTLTITGSQLGTIDTPVTRTLTVYESVNGRYVAPGSIVIDPVEKIDIAVDWANVLREGETIINAVFEEDPGVTDLLITNVISGSPKARGWFDAGTEGKSYQVEHRVTTNLGATYNCSFHVICIDL